MSALEQTKISPKTKLSCVYLRGNAGRRANRTKNEQGGKFIGFIQHAFGYANIGPCKGCISLSLTTGANKSNLASFNAALLSKCVYASEATRKSVVPGLPNPGMLPSGFMPLPGKCHQLIAVGDKESSRDLVLLRMGVIQIEQELVFVKVARLSEYRESLACRRPGWVNGLGRSNQEPHWAV